MKKVLLVLPFVLLLAGCGTDKQPENIITQDEALEIAFERAEVDGEMIKNVEIDKEKENDVVYYDIEFDDEEYEYSIEVNAEDKSILKYEREEDGLL